MSVRSSGSYRIGRKRRGAREGSRHSTLVRWKLPCSGWGAEWIPVTRTGKALSTSVQCSSTAEKKERRKGKQPHQSRPRGPAFSHLHDKAELTLELVPVVLCSFSFLRYFRHCAAGPVSELLRFGALGNDRRRRPALPVGKITASRADAFLHPPESTRRPCHRLSRLPSSISRPVALLTTMAETCCRLRSSVCASRRLL